MRATSDGEYGRPRRRLKACVEEWPDCQEGMYDPRCCRFPKSCSCTVYADETAHDDLEWVGPEWGQDRPALHAPWWTDGHRTILNARCEDVLPTLADESFDIVVTSPPYNMGLIPGGNGRGMYPPGATGRKASKFRHGYSDHADTMPQDEYDEWQRWCLAEVWRIARLGVFYNHRPRVEHGKLRTPLSGDYGPGLVLRQIIVWDRGTGIDVNLRHFCTRGEWIMLFAKPAFTLIDHSASGMGDVWRITPDSVKGHPAAFPVAFPARCIAATGARSVLDPFVGSGSTLRAAADAGIEGLGIESSADYCAIATGRLAQMSLLDGVTSNDGLREEPGAGG